MYVRSRSPVANHPQSVDCRFPDCLTYIPSASIQPLATYSPSVRTSSNPGSTLILLLSNVYSDPFRLHDFMTIIIIKHLKMILADSENNQLVSLKQALSSVLSAHRYHNK